MRAATIERAQRAGVARYVFSPNEVFSVEAAPGFSTDIILEPGEKLSAHPTAGDSARWAISVQRAELFGGKSQIHVFVRPLRPGLSTNLTLTTSARTYLLHLSAASGRYMSAVRWSYPLKRERLRRQRTEKFLSAAALPTLIADITALRCLYELTATRGTPSWAPRSVCDDGQKTFIQFPFSLTRATAPRVVVQRTTGPLRSAKFINVAIEGDLFVVHSTFDIAELRRNVRCESGELEEEVIRLVRKGDR